LPVSRPNLSAWGHHYDNLAARSGSFLRVVQCIWVEWHKSAVGFKTFDYSPIWSHFSKFGRAADGHCAGKIAGLQFRRLKGNPTRCLTEIQTSHDQAFHRDGLTSFNVSTGNLCTMNQTLPPCPLPPAPCPLPPKTDRAQRQSISSRAIGRAARPDAAEFAMLFARLLSNSSGSVFGSVLPGIRRCLSQLLRTISRCCPDTGLAT
jgi:hypothetical protein